MQTTSMSFKQKTFQGLFYLSFHMKRLEVVCALLLIDSRLPDSRYFIASQDGALRSKARRVPGTPVLYLHRAAPTLEKPSDLSHESADHNVTER